MQQLLWDRATSNTSPLEFAKTIIESSYLSLQQKSSVTHSNGSINSLSLENQDYQFLLSGSADLSIKLWDLHNESVIGNIPRKTAHDYGISCISWWPIDNGMFISSSFDHTVKIWDTNELSIIHEFNVNNRVYSFDIKNNLISVASDQPFIRLLDLRSSSNATTLKGHKFKTLAIKWHPKNDNLIASGGYDGEIKIWDIRRSQSCLCRLDMLNTSNNYYSDDNLIKETVKAHLSSVNGLIWDQLGNTLFSTGNDDKIRVWDMINSNWPPINKLINFGPLTRNKFLQNLPLTLNYKYETNLQYIIFPSDNGDIYIYRTIDGKLIHRLHRKDGKDGRIVSIVMDKSFTNRFYCGSIDGEITKFEPEFNKYFDIEKVFDLDR